MEFSLHSVNNIFTSNKPLEGTPYVNHPYGNPEISVRIIYKFSIRKKYRLFDWNASGLRGGNFFYICWTFGA